MLDNSEGRMECAGGGKRHADAKPCGVGGFIKGCDNEGAFDLLG
jgi:hypothetical protein